MAVIVYDDDQDNDLEELGDKHSQSQNHISDLHFQLTDKDHREVVTENWLIMVMVIKK